MTDDTDRSVPIARSIPPSPSAVSDIGRFNNGIFPRGYDGGLPANPNTPNDPTQAFLHRHKLPVDTSALYFGNGCDVRLRPHVINSLISEIAALADRAGVGYRQSSLQNTEIAARYLIQRGLPHAAMLVEENPWYFRFSVDPPPPCETDFMTCTFVPRMDPEAEYNRGYLRINMNGLGYRPLLRWDGNECRQGDILPFKPFMASYFNGAWYIIGRIPPEFRPGGIDLWVRTDGNDATADGVYNRPDRAFRTIEGAFRSVGERFMATPLFTANIKLGIPGDYESAVLGPFGSNLTITGGGSDAGGWGGGSRWDYRIRSKFYAGENIWIALQLNAVNNVALYGIDMMIDQGSFVQSALLVGGRTNCSSRNCAFEAWAGNGLGRFIDIRDSTWGADETAGTSTWFQGNGTTQANAISVWRGVTGMLVGYGGTLVSTNFHCAAAYLSMNQLASCTFGGYGNNAWGGITGMQYAVSANSVLYHNLGFPSGPVPGTIPGTSSYGSQVIPGYP